MAVSDAEYPVMRTTGTATTRARNPACIERASPVRPLVGVRVRSRGHGSEPNDDSGEGEDASEVPIPGGLRSGGGPGGAKGVGGAVAPGGRARRQVSRPCLL